MDEFSDDSFMKPTIQDDLLLMFDIDLLITNEGFYTFFSILYLLKHFLFHWILKSWNNCWKGFLDASYSDQTDEMSLSDRNLKIKLLESEARVKEVTNQLMAVTEDLIKVR